MQKEQFVSLIKPTLEKQTQFQFSQVRAFVDNALKEAVTNNFDSESQKIKYLLETLFNIRDFTSAQLNENSLRLSLIQQFQQLEKEIEVGNDVQQQKEKSSENLDEKLESNPQN